MPEDCFELAEFAVAIARRAGKQVMAQFPLGRWQRGAIEHKGGRELVSEVDRASEQLLVRSIEERYPEHAIVAEEGGALGSDGGSAPYCWFVDPLDGTTNFLHGHPIFAVSLAVERRLPADGAGRGAASADEPDIVAAAVYLPYLDEMYLAAQGGGAYLNSRTIRLAVSSTPSLEDALVSTGFAYDRERYPNYDNFVRVAREARGIRRCGAAAADLAFVAAGRYDAFWELGLRPHDVAAGALLVSEAGGRLEDVAGGQRWLHGGSIIATNGHVHAALRELLDPVESPSR